MELYEYDDECEAVYLCGNCEQGSMTFKEESGMFECDTCDFKSSEM